MTAPWPALAGLHTSSDRLSVNGQVPSFDAAIGWLNSLPLTATDRSGKIIVVNFWTYTCIDWLRQLPYLRAWAGRYRPSTTPPRGLAGSCSSRWCPR